MRSERIFVDTGAWFALLVDTDQHHQAALGWFLSRRAKFLTTDYVVDELLTLLRSRFGSTVSIRAGRELLETDLATVEPVSGVDFAAAWQLFSRFEDKAWSFTDCVSRVVMQRLEIATAFAFDEHFRQFGTVSVVP